MAPLGMVLWVFAFVLFVLASLPSTAGAPEPRRFRSMMAAGWACIAAAQIFALGPAFFKQLGG